MSHELKVRGIEPLPSAHNPRLTTHNVFEEAR